MSEPSALPALPDTIMPLSDADSGRLHRLYPDLWANPHTSCLTCLGKKEFLGREGKVTCDCVAQWALHRFLLNAGVPLGYQRISTSDVDEQVPGDVIEAVLNYSTEAERYLTVGFGAILLGKPGTGKTMLAVLLLKSLLSGGYDGYFTQFNTMLDDYTSGWQSREDKQWFARRVMNAGVLVVDDIGKENRGRDSVITPMFDQVIRSRVASDRPTIITTNFTMDEMRSGYGGSVMSLLAEKCFDYEVTGKDFRERAKERTQAEIVAGIRRPITLA